MAGEDGDPVFELMGWISEPMLLKRLLTYIIEGVVEVVALAVAMHLAELHLRPQGLFLRLLMLPLSIVTVKVMWATRLAVGYCRMKGVSAATAIRRMSYVHSRGFWTCSAAIFTCFSCVLMVWHCILFLLVVGYDYTPQEALASRFLLGSSAVFVVTNWAFWRDFVRNYRDAVEESNVDSVVQILRMYRSGAFRLLKHKDISADSGTKADHSMCVVCLEEFKPQDEVSQLHCGHVFHPTCAHKWLREDWRCPFRCALVAPQSPKAISVGAQEDVQGAQGPAQDLEVGGARGIW
mmetsp:Transcript_64622/g.192523  ORF Transcript_64622/g.192523 Transcript_64622/m.192523 type:complete len:293 (-) Transcript_64622:259-1137(-)